MIEPLQLDSVVFKAMTLREMALAALAEKPDLYRQLIATVPGGTVDFSYTWHFQVDAKILAPAIAQYRLTHGGAL